MCRHFMEKLEQTISQKPKGTNSQVKSSQVTFIYIALLTIQIVTKQLHNIKMGK